MGVIVYQVRILCQTGCQINNSLQCLLHQCRMETHPWDGWAPLQKWWPSMEEAARVDTSEGTLHHFLGLSTHGTHLLPTSPWAHHWGMFLMVSKKFENVINPLFSPSSEQDQFSPNNIHTLSRDRLWELMKWSRKGKCLDLLSIFPTNSLRKCMEISLEKLYVDIEA